MVPKCSIIITASMYLDTIFMINSGLCYHVQPLETTDCLNNKQTVFNNKYKFICSTQYHLH